MTKTLLLKNTVHALAGLWMPTLLLDRTVAVFFEFTNKAGYTLMCLPRATTTPTLTCMTCHRPPQNSEPATKTPVTVAGGADSGTLDVVPFGRLRVILTYRDSIRC